MSYNGYLLKFGNEIFPNKYLLADGYQSTPNQRTELEAYRDADILLHRATSPNLKTKLIFSVCPMPLPDKENLQIIINNSMISTVERKCRVEYFNAETNSYATGIFYISDVTYQTMGFFGGERWFSSVQYELTEY